MAVAEEQQQQRQQCQQQQQQQQHHHNADGVISSSVPVDSAFPGDFQDLVPLKLYRIGPYPLSHIALQFSSKILSCVVWCGA